MWGRMLAVLLGSGRKGFRAASLPSPVRITRPGDTGEPEKPDIETDARTIAAWFARNR